MTIANSALRASLAIISYPTRARGIIVYIYHQTDLSDDRVSVKLRVRQSYVLLISSIFRYITFCQRIEHSTVDFVSGMHSCLEFSQPLSCLYQAMQTQENSFLLLL